MQEEKPSEGRNSEVCARRDLSDDVAVVSTVLEGMLTQKMAAAALGEQVVDVPLQHAQASDDFEEGVHLAVPRGAQKVDVSL